MKRSIPRVLPIAAVAATFVCFVPHAAQAALSVSTSEAAWRASVGSPTLINFDDLANGTAVANQYAGLSFSSSNGGAPLAAAESAPFSLPNVLAVDDPSLGGGGGGVSIAFAAPWSGVGFYYCDSQFAGNSVTVYDAANHVLGSFEFEYPHPTEWLFVGFTSSGRDISRLDISMGSADRVTLDNVLYANAVPEPASWLLLLAGLGWVGAASKRRFSQRR